MPLVRWRTEIPERGPIRSFARNLVHAARRARDYPLLHMRGFTGSRPLSSACGFDRGTPVDRYYIEQFLGSHSVDIRGRVLEAGDDSYSCRFGGTQIKRQDILNIDDAHAGTTIVGDLGRPGLLPNRAFDCIVLTQTLQYVFNPHAAIEHIRSALRPGGTLLLTVPGVAPISLDAWQDSFYWRFTAHSVRRLLGDVFEPRRVEVSPLGNLYAATAFLHGAAVEELDRSKLQPAMPEYAIVIVARAVA